MNTNCTRCMRGKECDGGIKCNITNSVVCGSDVGKGDCAWFRPQQKQSEAPDPVNHPAHYTDGGIETIDFIEAKKLCYHLGNAIKYISRAGKKGDEVEDLRKAIWYLERRIKMVEDKTCE